MQASTYEEIDNVRGITNRSSGKMGLEIAREAFIQGADLTMVTGRTEVPIPEVFERVQAESTEEMQSALIKLLPENDIFISAAAVSDFTVENTSNEKTGKISSEENLTVKLKPSPKLLNSVKKINPKIFLVGFKAEYNVTEEELVLMAKKRIATSGADFIVANDVSVAGSGFGSDKNQVIIVDEGTFTVPLTSKKEIAKNIMAIIIEKMR